ncbi:hypothetical protein [Roseateles sp. LKC17W]|uniref:Helix-turn-helix domain-containing protein n=1 Tax=Pelomonas margarita TaxID=3299031 RepID=A0ABW7FFP7_9BURK
MNVLKPHLRITLQTLLDAGTSQREIERVTGIDRKTIRAYQKRLAQERAANSSGVATDPGIQIPPPRPPASATATTERHIKRHLVKPVEANDREVERRVSNAADGT